MFPYKHKPPRTGMKWCPYCEEYVDYHDYSCGHFTIKLRQRRAKKKPKREVVVDEPLWEEK